MSLLALTPFHIYPPMFGGAERCWNLLSRIGPVDIIALNWEEQSMIGNYGDVRYHLIAADDKAMEQAKKLQANGIRTYDPMPALCSKNLTTIRKAIDAVDPDLVILEHPWLVDLIDGRPYILDEHNFETFNTGSQYGTNSYDYQLVKDIEKHAIQQAEHVTYCSKADAEMIQQSIGFQSGATLIPNGVTLPTETAHGNTRNLIFIGSAYQPNVDAAQRLINIAHQLPDYTIQILGQCALYVRTDAPNVQLIGPIDNNTMHQHFVNAYAFINLVTHGSGTHLKIGRALAYGIPVLTTPTGGRGYNNIINCDERNIPDILNRLNWQQQHTKALQEAALLDWDIIGKRFKETIHEHL